MHLLACLLLFSQQSTVLASLERQLDSRFEEGTYRRYLYYCRQQNAAERLVVKTGEWQEDNPGSQLLRFGFGEGLLMAGDLADGVSVLKSLYRESPNWGNEIIFTMKELGLEEVEWFIEAERERTSNPILHATLMVDLYIRKGRNRKALSELNRAIASGANPNSFRRQIDLLSVQMGEEKVLNALKDVSGRMSFQLALQMGDEAGMKEVVIATDEKSELAAMGHLAERAGYFDVALEAFSRTGRDSDKARVLVLLGRDSEALAALAGDNSRRGMEQKAALLAGSAETYNQALEVYYQLERRYGVRNHLQPYVTALELLTGEEKKAGSRLAGLPRDSSALLLKAVFLSINGVEGITDSLALLVDASLISFPGNGYENDLLLAYEIALSQSAGLGDYMLALTAYHWGDAEDAYLHSYRLAQKREELADEALILAGLSLTRMRRWQDAHDIFLEVSENYSGSPLSARAQFERALILRDHLDDQEGASRLFTELVVRFSGSVYADLARQEM